MSQTTALQIREYSQEELHVIQQTLAKGTSKEQFQLFMKTAQYAGLNPFLNHIYCIVYGQGQNATMSIQISVEGMVYLAKQRPDYLGYDVQTVHENDEFKARRIKHENGEDSWEIVTHEVGFPRGKVIGCYAIAYREGVRPFVVLMDVEEVQHNLTGPNSSTWKKYFNDMFKKHVLKRAIRGQFGIDIAEDEMMIGSGVDQVPTYERRDITNEVNAARESIEPPKPEQEESQADLIADLRKQMNARFRQLGISGKENKAAYIEEYANFQDPSNPTVAELKGLIKIMDMQIADKQAAEDDDVLL